MEVGSSGSLEETDEQCSGLRGFEGFPPAHVAISGALLPAISPVRVSINPNPKP